MKKKLKPYEDARRGQTTLTTLIQTRKYVMGAVAQPVLFKILADALMTELVDVDAFKRVNYPHSQNELHLQARIVAGIPGILREEKDKLDGNFGNPAQRACWRKIRKEISVIVEILNLRIPAYVEESMAAVKPEQKETCTVLIESLRSLRAECPAIETPEKKDRSDDPSPRHIKTIERAITNLKEEGHAHLIVGLEIEHAKFVLAFCRERSVDPDIQNLDGSPKSTRRCLPLRKNRNRLR